MSTSPELSVRSAAAPALFAFGEIARAWSLNESEKANLLGQPLGPDLLELKAELMEGLQYDVLQRIGHAIGIYRALHTIFPDVHQANGWIRRPNNAAMFRGAPALTLICSGRMADLVAVRQYLESQY